MVLPTPATGGWSLFTIHARVRTTPMITARRTLAAHSRAGILPGTARAQLDSMRAGARPAPLRGALFLLDKWREAVKVLAKEQNNPGLFALALDYQCSAEEV
jgi:hypothetical protein